MGERIDSLKTVRYQFPSICNVLTSLQETSDDPKESSEATSLETHMYDYEFLVTLMVWYDVLFQINLVSKSLQKEDMDIPSAVSYLETCKEFLIRYRELGYAEVDLNKSLRNL